MTFVEAVKKGYAVPHDVFDYIEVWNETGSDVPLHEFLGCTTDQFATWIDFPRTITDWFV